MAEMDEKELKEGKRQLEGVLILCWVMAIITGLTILSRFSWGWGPIVYMTGHLSEPFTFDVAGALDDEDVLKMDVTPVDYVIPESHTITLMGLGGVGALAGRRLGRRRKRY